ncbi:hypothetical protein VTO42DRAFT_7347 [Malbranchea cinnamomea]
MEAPQIYPHHSQHCHGKSVLAQTNQEYWNSAADTTFELDWVKDLQNQVANHMQAHLAWAGINPDEKSNEGKKMLDYACGEGFLSRVLFPYFSKCIGMDIAEKMASLYNKSARDQGIPEDRMYAIQGDLTSSEASDALNDNEFFDFDLIIVSMALHHFEDPQYAINKFVERLKPGTGILVVIDWEVNKGNGGKFSDEWIVGNNPVGHTVAHSGFEEEQLKEMMIRAGCDEADYVLFEEKTAIPMSKDGFKQLFAGKGRRKAAA